MAHYSLELLLTVVSSPNFGQTPYGEGRAHSQQVGNGSAGGFGVGWERSGMSSGCSARATRRGGRATSRGVLHPASGCWSLEEAAGDGIILPTPWSLHFSWSISHQAVLGQQCPGQTSRARLGLCNPLGRDLTPSSAAKPREAAQCQHLGPGAPGGHRCVAGVERGGFARVHAAGSSRPGLAGLRLWLRVPADVSGLAARWGEGWSEG